MSINCPTNDSVGTDSDATETDNASYTFSVELKPGENWLAAITRTQADANRMLGVTITCWINDEQNHKITALPSPDQRNKIEQNKLRASMITGRKIEDLFAK